ncbi:hypothetical protein O9K51_09595 [Purpureocillium lavendulum]|uniref:Uncharacterized protein n=1 Tax=Purpureocillium lavendulum TaxID=1247861 RepID=A0AB34FFF1_9HYPO|nr:hypothetical protein O9K51_09595 [Purpureocillium lavendulum]
MEVSIRIEVGSDLITLLRDRDGQALGMTCSRDGSGTRRQEVRKRDGKLSVSVVQPVDSTAYHSPLTSINYQQKSVARLGPLMLDGEGQGYCSHAHAIDPNFRVVLHFKSLERTARDWRRWLSHENALR